MTCPYRGVAAEGGLWARLEAVGMTVEMTAGVLAARMMEGMQFTLGPTMAFRRDTIRQMGGFKVTADYCADDFVLGNETWKLGQDSRSQPPRDRPHGHQFADFVGFHEAPGPLDEVHALLAAQRPLRHRAHLQHAVRPARARRRRLARPSIGGGSPLCVERSPRASRSLSLSAAASSATSWFGLLVLYPIRDLMGFCLLGRQLRSATASCGAVAVFELLPGGKMRAAK